MSAIHRLSSPVYPPTITSLNPSEIDEECYDTTDSPKTVVFSYEDLTQTNLKGRLPEFMQKKGITGTFQQRMQKLIEIARQGTTKPPFDPSKKGEWSFAVDMGMRGLNKKNGAENKPKAPNHLTVTLSYNPPDEKSPYAHFHGGEYKIFTADAQGNSGVRGDFTSDGQSLLSGSLIKNQYRGSDLLDLSTGLCAFLGASNVMIEDAAEVTCHHKGCSYEGGGNKFILRNLRVFTEEKSKGFYASRGYEPIDPKGTPEIKSKNTHAHPSSSAHSAAISYLRDLKIGDVLKMFSSVEKSVEVAPKTLHVLRKAKDLTKAEDSTPLAEVIKKVYARYRSPTCDKETHLLMHELYDYVIVPTQLAAQLPEKRVSDLALRYNPLVTDLDLILTTTLNVTLTTFFVKRSFSTAGP